MKTFGDSQHGKDISQVECRSCHLLEMRGLETNCQLLVVLKDRKNSAQQFIELPRLDSLEPVGLVINSAT